MKLILLALFCVVVLLTFVSYGNSTLQNPCNYCKYCSYCDQCKSCPCDESKNANCKMCKYCTYCKVCNLCSSCQQGGVLATVANLYTSIAENLGFSVESLDDAQLQADLASVKLPADKKKSEL